MFMTRTSLVRLGARHISALPAAPCVRVATAPVGRSCTAGPLRANGADLRRRFLHSTRSLREEADPKKVKTREMLAYEASQRGEITTARKVVEAGRDATYLVVMLAGLGLTGLFAYSVFGELFGGNSPNALYSKALKKVAADDRVRLLLGDSIKGFGEETRRGRRRHIPSQEYEVDGQVYLRMRFYVQGSLGTGTVHLEVKKGLTGLQYRYLFVELPDSRGGPSEYVVLEDNR